ncbi:MAG: O-antigen ligase family protein [Lachnospiraceae bacterium]|nr:O-antigen ligase family protein [Lachnospiraceae bacterium]
MTENKLSIKNLFIELTGLATGLYTAFILLLMPFYFTEGFCHIGTDKSDFFVKLTKTAAWVFVPMLLLCLGLVIADTLINKKSIKDWKIKLPDIFVFMYGVSIILSYFLSDYREEALFGAVQWYMGLFTKLAFVILYFLISRTYFSVKDKVVKPHIYLIMAYAASFVVYCLGYLNRFGIFPIDMKVENVLFLSTIGNINWYCGYMMPLLFSAIALFVIKDDLKPIYEILLQVYIFAGFLTFATQGSRSALVGAYVAVITLLFISYKNEKRMDRMLRLMMMFGISCGVTYIITLFPIQGVELTFSDSLYDWLTIYPTGIGIMALALILRGALATYTEKKGYPEKLFKWLTYGITGLSIGGFVLFISLIWANTKNPGCLGKLSNISIFTFDPTWSSNRGATWMAGFMSFGEQNFVHKLFGIGPDCMCEFIKAKASPRIHTLLSETFGNLVLTNAHNELLTNLLNQGIFGMVAFLGMVITAIRELIRTHKDKKKAAAIAIGIVAYFANNMVSFEQVMGGVTFYIVMGLGMRMVNEEN